MIRTWAIRIFFAGIACCLASPLFGQEFSADLIVKEAQATDASSAGKMYVGKDKVRIELKGESGMGKMGGVVIMDLTHQVSEVLMPQRHMYMELPQGRGPQHNFSFFRPSNLDDACADWLKMAQKPGGTCHRIGHEVVNGRDTVKYEGTNADGDKGDVWLDTKLKFAVKWQGTNRSGELRNIVEASQPGSLFEVPSDYQKMDMGSMMGHPAPPSQ